MSKKLVSLFRNVNFKTIMNDKELKVFNELKDTDIIRCGVTSYNANNIKALSWSLDYDNSEYIANRFGEKDGTVYKPTIYVI